MLIKCWHLTVGKRYVYSIQNKPTDDWFFQGGISFNKKKNTEIRVTKSDSGALLMENFLGAPKRWKNLKLNFNLSFDQRNKNKILGIIFRAKDLDNYYMLQLAVDKTNSQFIIRPHIRFRGNWDFSCVNLEEDDYKKKVFLVEDKSSIEIIIKEDIASVYIDNNSVYDWYLPSYTQYTQKESRKQFEDKLVQELTFKKSYGFIGFRAFSDENAIINGLQISSL